MLHLQSFNTYRKFELVREYFNITKIYPSNIIKKKHSKEETWEKGRERLHNVII